MTYPLTIHGMDPYYVTSLPNPKRDQTQLKVAFSELFVFDVYFNPHLQKTIKLTQKPLVSSADFNEIYQQSTFSN